MSQPNLVRTAIGSRDVPSCILVDTPKLKCFNPISI